MNKTIQKILLIVSVISISQANAAGITLELLLIGTLIKGTDLNVKWGETTWNNGDRVLIHSRTATTDKIFVVGRINHTTWVPYGTKGERRSHYNVTYGKNKKGPVATNLPPESIGKYIPPTA